MKGDPYSWLVFGHSYIQCMNFKLLTTPFCENHFAFNSLNLNLIIKHQNPLKLSLMEIVKICGLETVLDIHEMQEED